MDDRTWLQSKHDDRQPPSSSWRLKWGRRKYSKCWISYWFLRGIGNLIYNILGTRLLYI